MVWVIDWCGRWSGRLGASLVPLMMFVVSYEVAARYLLDRPTIWANETAQYLSLASIALGGALLLQQGGHVQVTLLSRRLGTRSRALLDVATSLFFFAFVGALLENTATTALDALIHGQHSPSYWAPPIFPVYLIMTVGVGLTLLQGVAKLIRDLRTAISGRSETESGPPPGGQAW